MDQNPFDALDETNPDVLAPGAAPGLGERFWLNYSAGQRYNTILGAARDAGPGSRAEDRRRFDAKYEAFPEWQGFLEGSAAVAGQVVGTGASPENFIPVGLGEKIIVLGKMGLTGLWAKVFAGAIDSAAVNAVSDAAIQGIEIGAGHRDSFDPLQYAASVFLGAGIGGAGGAVARGVEVRGERNAAGKLFAAARGEKAANPFDALDDTPTAAPLPENPEVVPAAASAPAQNASGKAAPAPVKPVPENPQVAKAAPAEQSGETSPAATPAPKPNPEAATLGETLSMKAIEVRGTGPFGPINDPEPFRSDWAGAVDHLSREQTGEISGLLSHPEIGPIDVVWGSYDPATGKGAGMAKIKAKHPDVVDNLPELVASLPVKSRSENRIVLESADHSAVIRLTYDGEQKTWLLTAYELGADRRSRRRAEGTTERLDSRQEDTSSSSPAEGNIGRSDTDGNGEELMLLGQGRQAEASPAPQEAIGGRPGADSEELMLLKQSREAKASLARQDEIGQFMATPVQTSALRGQRQRPAGGGAATSKAATNIERVRNTAETLAAALGVAATRQGRLPRAKGGKVLGVYKTGSGVVRVKSLDDFDVLSHEYGHHVEKRIPGMTPLMKAHAAELKALDYDPAAGRPEEGFAEFFRLWLTNRPYAEKEAPGFAKAFEAELVKHPEIRSAIEDASKAWSDFLSAPSTVAVASTIVSAKRGGWLSGVSTDLRKAGVAGTIHDTLQRIYTFLFDDLNPLSRAVASLQALHLANKGSKLDLNVSSDAYKLARMSRGAYAQGHMDVMYGVAPYGGLHPESPSLRDAIVEATGKPNALSGWDERKVQEFGAYLWSRRAVGEWERFLRGEIPNPPDKLTRGDHVQNVADLTKSNPQFATAAARVHEFSRALWKKKFDAGLIDETTYNDGLAIVDYVPGLRDFSSDTDMPAVGRKAKGRAAKSGFARRFRGSKRDVINPLESLAADAYETAMAISRNDIVKALDRLALSAGPGSASIAERIPAKEMRGSMIDALEAVETAARNAGLAKADIVVLRDAVESAVGAEKAAVFRPAVINEKGEPIVFFRDGGQLRALRLADGRFGQDLYRTFAAMNGHERNFWVELVAMPARLLRLGITTAPEFIGANFIRDQTMAAIFYGSPLRRLGRSLQGAGDDLLGNETAKAYARVSGLSGGAQTASMPEAMAERDISALRRKGWLANRLTSLRGLLQVTEIAETGTRLGLFRTFVDEAKERGLDELEAALEASWRARDYIDFDRRGSGMAALARLVPFLNASMQGLDKGARHMIVPLAKKVLGHDLSPAETRDLGVAVKSWARLAGLITASVSLYALQSRHEDYDEVSATTKATHWMVKAGERWVAIPKPFELAMPINLAEAAFDAMVKQDPTAYGRWADSLFTTLLPPSLIEGNPAVKTYFELKSNTNFFTGAPIVPETLQGMEPFLQYTARTSALSKQLGNVFNISPAIADHVITAHLGSWGRSALSLYDLAQPDGPGFAWDDAPISRRFIKDASKGAQSTTMFWNMVGEREGKLEGKALSWRTLAESGDAAGAADYFASQNDQAKAYIAMSVMDAKVRRLHPMIRARGAVQAIGAIRRDLAAGRLADGEGAPIAISAAERTAADDILSTLSMAIARNSLVVTGEPGWAQRPEISEDGFYRELEALSPALLQRLADGYVTSKVWSFDAVKATWPELRQRVLAEGSSAPVLDLVGQVQASGNPVAGGMKIRRKEKPELVP